MDWWCTSRREYYLVHQRQRVEDAAQLEQVAGREHEASFRLAKEIKQG
jgi:hypothetical protein